MTADILFREVQIWADRTFGKGRSKRSIIVHLDEELNELAIAVDHYEKGWEGKEAVLEELADVQILLWNLAQTHGICFNKLTDAVFMKHRVNLKRDWKEVDGKMKHSD
jgi:NTP pyrophosphatase (non-canonical NTP hydrolase)